MYGYHSPEQYHLSRKFESPSPTALNCFEVYPKITKAQLSKRKVKSMLM